MKIALILLLQILFLTGCATTPSGRSCRLENLKWGDQNIKINVSRYGGNDSLKSIIIIPPTGRTNYIDRKYAEQFCEAGFDSYIMDDWTGDIETTTELEIHQRFYSTAQTAISLVLEQIKSPYVGLLGTSVGGLHAAIAANTHERLNAVFVIAGGIPIAEVIVNSDQKAMVDLRKDRQKRYGFKTGQENIEAIEKAFSLEPKTLPPLYKKKTLGLAIGLQDETVPTATQIQLKEFWEPSKMIEFKNDHFWTIVKTWLFKSTEITNFFQKSYQEQSLLAR